MSAGPASRIVSNRTKCTVTDRISSPSGWARCSGEGVGGVDEPDVGECLWEVAEQLTGGGVDLFGEQADVVGEADEAFEERACPVQFADLGQALDEPERADGEGSFAAFEAVSAR